MLRFPWDMPASGSISTWWNLVVQRKHELLSPPFEDDPAVNWNSRTQKYGQNVWQGGRGGEIPRATSGIMNFQRMKIISNTLAPCKRGLSEFSVESWRLRAVHFSAASNFAWKSSKTGWQHLQTFAQALRFLIQISGENVKWFDGWELTKLNFTDLYSPDIT